MVVLQSCYLFKYFWNLSTNIACICIQAQVCLSCLVLPSLVLPSLSLSVWSWLLPAPLSTPWFPLLIWCGLWRRWHSFFGRNVLEMKYFEWSYSVNKFWICRTLQAAKHCDSNDLSVFGTTVKAFQLTGKCAPKAQCGFSHGGLFNDLTVAWFSGTNLEYHSRLWWLVISTSVQN